MKMKVFFILALTLLSFGYSDLATNVNKFVQEFANEMSEKGLICVGSGGRIENDRLSKIDLLFVSYQRATVEKARELEVFVTESLLKKINKNKSNKKFLNLPFKVSDAMVSISFNTEWDDFIHSGNVACVFQTSNVIYYREDDQKSHELVPITQERYTDCVKYMNGQQKLPRVCRLPKKHTLATMGAAYCGSILPGDSSLACLQFVFQEGVIKNCMISGFATTDVNTVKETGNFLGELIKIHCDNAPTIHGDSFVQAWYNILLGVNNSELEIGLSGSLTEKQQNFLKNGQILVTLAADQPIFNSNFGYVVNIYPCSFPHTKSETCTFELITGLKLRNALKVQFDKFYIENECSHTVF